MGGGEGGGGGGVSYVYTVEPLITNSPHSENLYIADCFCGSRQIAMHVK